MDYPGGRSESYGAQTTELAKALGIDWNRSRGVIRCPAHDDAKPSLSYKWTNDGGLLLHCFAGCSFDAIRAAARGVR